MRRRRPRGERQDEVPWITASAIAQATYCPYQLYLARAGVERDAHSRRALARGGEAHEAWNARQRRAPSGLAIALLRVALALALVAALALLGVVLAGALGRA